MCSAVFLLVMVILGTTHPSEAGSTTVGSSVKTIAQLIEKNGYTSETHDVVTQDGYIVQLDRIPNRGRPPVLLTSMLFATTAQYLVLGRGRALGFILYEAGYDVWLGNYRGTGISNRHKTLSPKSEEYWKFSFHECGYYDNPAFIDFVLRETKHEQLVYLGYSMSSTAIVVTLATKPEYNKKVFAAFLMAPPTFMAHQTSVGLNLAHKTENQTQMIADALRIHEWLPFKSVFRMLDRVLCPRSQGLCKRSMDMIAGVNKEEYLDPNVPDMRDYFPSGGSVGQMLHFAQLSSPGWPGFRQFNWGPDLNLVKYGQRVPPDYDLAKCTVPMYLYVGDTDKVVNAADLKLLVSRLPNVTKVFWIPKKDFSHFDFAVSAYAPVYLFREIIEDLKALSWH